MDPPEIRKEVFAGTKLSSAAAVAGLIEGRIVRNTWFNQVLQSFWVHSSNVGEFR